MLQIDIARFHLAFEDWARQYGPVYRFDPLVRPFGAPVYRGFSPFRSFLRAFGRPFPRSLVASSGRWLFVPPLRSGTSVNRHVTNDTMESTWILNYKH